MRKCLLAILEAGYSPLRFYTSNIKKYFYLGELLALVDLSLARPPAACLIAERCQLPVQEGRLRFCRGLMGCARTDCEDGRSVQPLGRQRPEPGHRAPPQGLL